MTDKKKTNLPAVEKKKTKAAELPIEKRVASIAEKLANSGGPAKGDQKCWAFVHHVLYRARAMSFWEFNSGAEATSFSPWGKTASGPRRGYVVILKGTNWEVRTAQRDPTTGKLTQSNVISLPTLEGTGHIGVILHVSPKHIEIAQQNCTMTWKGIEPTQMSRLIVPITDVTHYEAAEHGKYFFYKLRKLGQISYFQPLVMPDGKRPSCPTAKAKQAAEIS